MRQQPVNEAKLNLTKLDDKSDIGLRGDVLVSKVRNEEPLTVSTPSGTAEIVVVNKEQLLKAITNRDGSYNSFRASRYFMLPNGRNYKLDAILGDDGNHYKLNDIEKTAEFGSSGGSSLGSVDTRYVESVTCIFLAWRQLKRKDLAYSDFEDIMGLDPASFADFKSRYTMLDDKLGLTQQDVSDYWDKWKESFVHIPNFLYYPGIVHSGFKNQTLLDSGRVYRFCQLSASGGAVRALRRAFQERHPGVNFAKWNPSDVFAVDLAKESEMASSLASCKSSALLNELVDRAFESRDMVGISLKKIKSSSDIRIIVNKITRPPRYKLATIRFSRMPFATLGLELVAERRSREFGHGQEVMVIRSRDSRKMINISAEVRGKTAKHGNMSLTQVNKILDTYGLEKVPSVGSRTEKHYEDEIEYWSDAELKREIVAINEKLLNHYDTVVEPRKMALEVDRKRLISKYQALFLAWILMEAQDYLSDREGYSLADRVVEDMFHFALSINITPGKESGRTPRYARIVD